MFNLIFTKYVIYVLTSMSNLKENPILNYSFYEVQAWVAGRIRLHGPKCVPPFGALLYRFSPLNSQTPWGTWTPFSFPFLSSLIVFSAQLKRAPNVSALVKTLYFLLRPPPSKKKNEMRS